MKNKYLLGAFIALGLLTSCSSDENEVTPGVTGEQIIVLDMQDTDVLSSRSRPLASTENQGAELVTDVQFMLFKKDGSVYKFQRILKTVDNWRNESTDYNYGRKYTIKLGDNGTDKITDTAGEFIIYAVGQDEETTAAAMHKIELATGDKLVGALEGTDFTDEPWNLTSTPGTGFMQTAAIDYTDGAGAVQTHRKVGEIFSGVSTPLTFTADGGFQTTVLLKRQVAGVLGYFSSIPAYIKTGSSDDDYTMVNAIRLVASNRNDALDLTVAMSDQTDDTTHGTAGTGEEKAVNGYTVDATTGNAKDAGLYDTRNAITYAEAKDAYTIYEIDLTKWFTEKSGETGVWDDASLINASANKDEQLLGNVAGWQNALDNSNSDIRVADGSVLAGEFVIPFKRTEASTFELQLINRPTTGNVMVLKKWKVKLDTGSQADGDTETLYSIYRNHLYQIGKRGNTDNPTTPDEGDDQPQPLDKSQDLIIKINDQWEFIHDMVIE